MVSFLFQDFGNFKKLVTILGHFLMINLRCSRCMFCKMRVSVEKRTIHIAPASILFEILALCFVCLGLELAPAQLLLKMCFFLFALSIPIIKHML